MHHYTAFTSSLMFPGGYLQMLWQTHLPHEARSNPLLMHGLLAIAALHLGSAEPQDRSTHWLRALHHHSISLHQFNSMLSHGHPETSPALFTYVVLLAIWIFASPTVSGEILRLDTMLDQLGLLRGGRSFLILNMRTIQKTPIGKILSRPAPPNLPKLPLHTTCAVEALKERASDEGYLTAVDELQRLLQRSLSMPDDVRLGPAWISTLEDAFWNRLRSREPLAILIFAHYSLLLQISHGLCWWMVNWPQKVIQAVEQELTSTERAALDWVVPLKNLQYALEELSGQPVEYIGYI